MSEAARQVVLLNDKQLAEYLHKVNLKWIEACMALSLIKIGTQQWRDSYLRRKATEQVYATAATEALSRGMLVYH